MATIHAPRNVCLSFPLGQRGWRIDNDETWLTFPTDSDDLIFNLRIVPQVFWARQNVAVLFTAGCDGGVPPYTWTITGLPTGLTATTDGEISGTIPMGSYGENTDVDVSFQVEDSAAPTKAQVTLTQKFSVIGDPLRIVPRSFTVKAGDWFTGVLSAEGGKLPYTWQVTDLPSGIVLIPGDGSMSGIILSGAYPSGALFELGVTVTDAQATEKTTTMVMTYYDP